MIPYPIASNEKQRLAVLDDYHIIQTNKEGEFERISALAKAFFGTKIVAITFLDADIQFFKSRIGLKEHSTSRDVAFCNYTIIQNDTFPHCQNSCHPHLNNPNGGKGDNHGTIQCRTQTSNIKQTAIA